MLCRGRGGEKLGAAAAAAGGDRSSGKPLPGSKNKMPHKPNAGQMALKFSLLLFVVIKCFA